MKKSILLLPLAIFLLTGCNNPEKKEREDVPPEEEDIPFKLISELKEDEYKSFYKHYFKTWESLKTFKAITKGETVSKVVFVDVHQSIDVTVIKNEYSYMTNESHSDMVNTSHLVYYHNGKALYKDKWEENYHLSNLTDYLSVYGTYPFDQAIEGYIINQETITDISLEKKDDSYQIKLKLDNDKATSNVKIQMKQFGGLDDYPYFTDINLTLNLKDDYTPISIDVDASYKAKKLVETNCHQTYTVTYSNINEDIEVPDLDTVKPLFNE